MLKQDPDMKEKKRMTVNGNWKETVLEFMEARQEQGCSTGPPCYTAWQNWFLGIDSWALLKSLKFGLRIQCTVLAKKKITESEWAKE